MDISERKQILFNKLQTITMGLEPDATEVDKIAGLRAVKFISDIVKECDIKDEHGTRR